MLSPFLLLLVQGVRPLPRHSSTVLEKLAGLVPVAPLLDFTPARAELRELQLQEYERLERYYFEYILRVPDIGTLYPLIQEKVDLMVLWWD